MKFLRLFALLLVIIGAFSFYTYTSKGPLTIEKTVIIPRGSGFQKSFDVLAEQNVITQPLLVKAIVVALGNAKKVKAGEYKFPPEISPQEVVQMLVEGKVVAHKITVAEGLNVREVVALLAAEPVLEGAVPANIPEGSLLPETYHFTYGDTRASVVARMQEGMKKALAEAWAKRAENLPIKTPEEALVLASIVEKETGIAEERPRVAAVFINRLRLGMKLQSDPTTVYGLEQKTGAPLGRALTLNDLKSETPYNTYVINALPPAPIANPGLASINAALHPLDTKELYFVATGTGGHNFASSLSEHEKNVRAYRAKVK